jgi:sporulation protein YlmC with PRC-barrel domain
MKAMKWDHRLVTALWAVALMAAPASFTFAVDEELYEGGGITIDREEQTMQSMAAGQAQTQLIKSEEVIGQQAKNAQGEELGEVNDLIVDVGRGRVAYAIIQTSGALGMGQEFVAVPWQLCEQKAEEGEDFLTCNVTKQQIDQARKFTDDTWPDMSGVTWASETHRQFGATPYWEQESQRPGMQGTSSWQRSSTGAQAQPGQTGQSMGEPQAQQDQAGETAQPGEAATAERPTQFWLKKASDLTGMQVLNAQDEELGDLNQLIVDPREGRIVYGIVSYGGVLGIGGKLVAVPWSALELQPAQDAFVIDATKETLDELAFSSGDWPDLSNEQWALETHRAFEQQPYWEVFGYTIYEAAPAMGQVKTIQGEVTSIDRTRDEVRAQVQSADGQTHTVKLAPQSFLDQQTVTIEEGDQLTIQAQAHTENGQTIYKAHSVQKNGQQLQLRDAQGKARWQEEGEHGEMQDQEQESESEWQY